MAPFPAPSASVRDAVSPSSDSVFSHNSVSSNESIEERQSSRASPESTEHAQKDKQVTEHAQRDIQATGHAQKNRDRSEQSQQGVEVEITDNRVKREGLTIRTSSDDVMNMEKGVCASPEDIAKIEAFHNSISELATHFTTILFSESGEEVISSSQ